jgi:uncharacterized membrane protein YagU involved in acid resistance
MEALHRWPSAERQPLPPRQITMKLAEEAGLKRHMSEEERTVATVASHLAYGAGAGAVYGMLAARTPGHPALKGAGFGLLLWAVSYLGWLQATHVLKSATQHPARRNALMIAAHLVWGITLGVFTERWSEEKRF